MARRIEGGRPDDHDDARARLGNPMTRPGIVVAAVLPPAVEQAFVDRYGARLLPLGTMSPGEFASAIEGSTIVVPAVGVRFDRALIAALPESVRLIANFGAGTDHIDRIAAAARGMMVSNTPDVLTAATADIAMLLILSALRGASEAERELRAGAWRGWTPADIRGHDLAGRTLGIWGFGRTGRATAARAAAFGVRIVYHGRKRHEAEEGARFIAERAAFLREAEVLSLHMPATAETRGILDRATIAALRPGAVVINTARGELVDDDALIDALEGGHIGAVGLDVFAGEPAFNPRWLSAPRTVLLPHIGSGTHETRMAMGMRVMANIDAFLAGEPLPDRVA
jgi:lactate dehydrogenase-like 2-hydroxyacid dehydrogenase